MVDMLHKDFKTVLKMLKGQKEYVKKVRKMM